MAQPPDDPDRHSSPDARARAAAQTAIRRWLWRTQAELSPAEINELAFAIAEAIVELAPPGPATASHDSEPDHEHLKALLRAAEAYVPPGELLESIRASVRLRDRLH